ncbi:MAG: glycosyltransferase family 4 protein [Azonexus sp.]|nr:glycosyltransferase family 4 protein [Azonexus sp.]
MKILLTTPTYPPFNSGLGNAVQQQATALVANGYSVVVATGGKKRAQRIDEVSGATVEEFNVQGADYLLNPIRGDVQSYEQFLAASIFDVVLMNAWQTWSTDLCLRNLKKISGRKLLYSHCVSTNMFFWQQPFRSMVRYLFWRPYWWKLSSLIRQLNGLVFLASDGCDSRFDDLRLARKVGIPVHVVPNALSSSATVAVSQPKIERKARKQLIAIGSYDWLKGHDFALHTYACSLAKNRIPLRIFGQSLTAFTEHLRQLVLSLGIEEGFVTFHEGVSGDSLLDECGRSIAILSGSLTECQPLVLLDAMATGTPFVARRSGCIPSLPGGVAVNTKDEAVHAIDKLLSDEIHWQHLSEVGRVHVVTNCDPVSIGRQLVAVLEA